jgi:hypothetical protein
MLNSAVNLRKDFDTVGSRLLPMNAGAQALLSSENLINFQ